MAISNNVGGRGSGASIGLTSVAAIVTGAVILPNTGENQTFSVLAIIAIAAGVTAITSHLGVRFYKRFSK